MDKIRALIVDDSSVMRKIVERSLRQAGIELEKVVEASNGAEALAALQAHMDIGTYGGEVVRHRHEKMQFELNWIRRLRRLVKSDFEDGRVS